MRLIGGRDYYDSGQAYGFDPTTVFVRNKRPAVNYRDLFPHESPESRMFPYPWTPVGFVPKRHTSRTLLFRHFAHHLTYQGTKYAVSGLVVTLCGKVFHGLVAKPVDVNALGKLQHVFWDFDSFVRWVARSDYALDTRRSWQGQSPWDQTQRFFEPVPVMQRFQDWLVSHHITILTGGINKSPVSRDPDTFLIDHAVLHLYEFYRVVDPVTCYQEIEMWVGGVLPRPGPAMVEITDDAIKAAKHGFDHHSFRKGRQDGSRARPR